MSGAPLTLSISVSSRVFSCEPHDYTHSRRKDQKSLEKSSLSKPLERNENRGQKVFLRVWLLSLISLRVNAVCQCDQGVSPHPTMQFFLVGGVTNDSAWPLCALEVCTDTGALTSKAKAEAHNTAPISFNTRP